MEFSSSWSVRSRVLLASCAGFVLCFTLGNSLAGAEDVVFLRGDANSDGVMSISDSHYILSFLFRGEGPPSCLSTADLDRDGAIDISDAIYGLSFLILGGRAPCDPFPEPGPGPIDSPGCESYGGGEPLEDPQARLEVVAAGVGTDGRVALTVLISNSADIAGYSGVLSVEGDILANGQSADVVDLSGTMDTGFNGARVLGKQLHFGLISSLIGTEAIPAGQSVAVQEITVCIARDTAPGQYALTLEEGELVDPDSGRAIHPALAAGTIDVPAGLAADAGCLSSDDPDQSAGDCTSPPQPPQPPNPPLPPPPGEVPSADFLRGDTNSDGVMSIADSHYILSFLFRGQNVPPCMSAADLNHDSSINISDAIYGLNYLIFGGPMPCEPFPEAGTGPADNLGCLEYGNGEPLNDPLARLEVVGAEVGADGRVTLTVLVSSSADIAGYSGVLSVEGDVLANGQSADVVDLSGIMDAGFSGGRVFGEKLRFGFIRSLIEPEAIPGGESVAVQEITVCIARDTAPGQYALTLEEGELVDPDSGRAIHPVLVAGAIEVPPGLAADAGCPSSADPDQTTSRCGGESPPPPPPPPPPPADIAAMFKIGGSTASAGGTFDVPFIISASLEVQGFAFSVDFDEEVLEALAVEEIFLKPDGTEYGFEKFEFNNKNDIPGSAGVDEGFIVGAAVFSLLDNNNNLPADQENEVLSFHFQVAPETTVEATEVAFVDGGRGSGQPVQNVLTAGGTSYSPERVSSFILLNGQVNILLGEETRFLRGDSNGDLTVDITDARVTLSYLFIGDATPACFDAADVDDDGLLNVTDPIATVTYLFLSGPAPREPFPDEGEDPTADSMTCSHH